MLQVPDDWIPEWLRQALAAAAAIAIPVFGWLKFRDKLKTRSSGEVFSTVFDRQEARIAILETEMRTQEAATQACEDRADKERDEYLKEREAFLEERYKMQRQIDSLTARLGAVEKRDGG